ncbi:Ff.00g096520.m01.CDS01 [Fusarium sp. VM40]|nr:Ff.00g096520.m01.CDS01 [Fusarium sp. VM40]
MLKQLILIAPLLVHAALAVPAVEPRHQHLHGNMDHTHGTKTTMTTSVRREAEATVEAQFIPPKMPYALKPNTKTTKPTAAAEPDDPEDSIIPGFIPPKMPFVPKSGYQPKSAKVQSTSEKSVSVASVNNKKAVAKVEDEDDTDTKSTFIPPRSPFRGARKPSNDIPRDTLPQFIPPRNPWGQSRRQTRSVDNDGQGASEETAVPDINQGASQDDEKDSSTPELLKRDGEDGDNEFFEEEDDDELSTSDFPNLGGSEDAEVNTDSNPETDNTPVGNASEQENQDQEYNDTEDVGNANNYFGGDYSDEDDANNTPTRLEARGVAKRNILYFTNWGTYGANFQPQDLPVKEITHVLYSFANVNAKDGSVVSSDSYADINRVYAGDVKEQGKNVYGCVKQLYLLKKKNRNLKVLLSIGGFNGSPALASGVSTQAGRQRFVATAVKLITDWGFDGIDIDWEYPANAQEARNYVSILSGVRKALDNYSTTNKLNYHFLLTVATSAGAGNYNIMNMKGMDAWLDAWHLMAYDYSGPWDSTTGHQANVFASKNWPLTTKLSTDKALNDYIAAGVPPKKILMGMPLYGRSFSKTDGFGKSYSGMAGNSEGIYLLKELPRPGAKTSYNADLIASYTYDSKKRELVTMDDLKSGQAKAGYINERGLGGAFYWEASGDRLGSASVVAGVKRTLGTLEKVNNLLKYPTSAYDNIRKNMA